MARSKITATSKDLITDSGSALWSIIQGEQLELPIILDFVSAALQSYVYKAAIVEGLNGGGVRPNIIQPNGVRTELSVRLPAIKGEWDASTPYSFNDVVFHSGDWYLRTDGVNIVEAITPDVSPYWRLSDPRTVYIQIPETLSVTPAYAEQPTIDMPVYGFIELSVSENPRAAFPRRWKPVRGLIEILYSPTL
jgi:hypothetical protein